VEAAGSARDREQAQTSFRAFARKQNFGFTKVDIMPGNIGYVELDRFFDINEESISTADAVFSVVRNSSALIIDLRKNGGGSPDMVRQICSYLFPVRTHITDVFERRANKTTEYWTAPDNRFRSLFSVPIYVLVGKRTFSAGEGLAFALQNQRRATIIGETTGGGAHLVSANDVGHGFSANVPYARALDPVTKTNWEAVGVKPEIRIGADSAVDAAVLRYYEFTMGHSTDSSELRSVRWSRDMLQARLHPASVDTAQLRDFTGDYEKRLITLENGSLYFTGANGNKSKLIAMSPTVMRMENTEDMTLEFQQDRGGHAVAMLVTFSDGFTSRFAKKS
jgi:hypothetical protein